MHKAGLRPVVFISFKSLASRFLRNYNNLTEHHCATSFKFLPYQLTMVVYWTTMAVTGNGELGFDSGEGA